MPKVNAQTIKTLMPQSIGWFIRKGYCERLIEDGVQVIKLTEAGHEYLARIQTGGTRVQRNSSGRGQTAP